MTVLFLPALFCAGVKEQRSGMRLDARNGDNKKMNMMAELKTAVVHGLEVVVTLSYVYAVVLSVAAFVKAWRKK